MDRIIYLDNNATTKTDPGVLEAMMPYLTEEYGNASSIHNFGMVINKVVHDSRERVADLIGADESEIIFTSGATESINIALKGFALANQGKGKHIITVKTEHKAVLDTCSYLESIGFEVTYLPVEIDGLIDIENFKGALRHDSILVCVMQANNETGVLQPLQEISRITHDAGAFFMSDVTQSMGKMPINVNDISVDLMAFSGHKFYGPKGIGGLYVRNLGKKKTKLESILHGGGHENGLRSGTLNVPGIVGLAKACEVANKQMRNDSRKIRKLRDVLESEFLKTPGSFVNGNIEHRMYHVSNICFPGINADVMIGKMKNVAVSNGSACTSSIIEPSHVLKAIGLSDDDALASIRFSLGKFNTENDVATVLNIFRELLIQSL